MFCSPSTYHGPAADYFGPAVRNQEAAIIIARAVWLSKHPELENESEAAWLKNYKAELWDGAWYVSRPNAGRGGLEIRIARRDGRLLDITTGQ